VLIPPWIRRRREGRPAESILSFHRKLWELERTSIYSDAAYSDAAYGDAGYDDVGHGEIEPLADGRVARFDPAGASVAARRVDARPPGRSGSPSAAGSGPGSPSPAQRQASRTALRRRRRVFSGLLGGLIASLVGAVIVGTPTAWVVHAVASVLFVTYIAMLVQHHQRLVEQVAKVRYISPIRAPRPAVVVLRSGTDSR
jgi:hypothetical protein